MSSNYYRKRRRKNAVKQVLSWGSFALFNLVSLATVLYLNETGQLNVILDPINKFYQAIGLK